eukprot:XP_011601908.1 PREDICTED: meiosis inhibitor protein 1-like [Takifugu rubripes]
MSVDIVSDKIHSRHDPKWSGRLGPAEGGGLLVCVACVIEMIESDDVSSVRKTFALSAVSGMFKSSPRALRDLLRQDHRVSLRFTASLLGMLHTMADQDTLEKVDQVLVQLLVALHSEMSPCFILDEIQKQLSNQPNMKHFFPTFTFLGNLMEAVPDVAHILVTQYVLDKVKEKLQRMENSGVIEQVKQSTEWDCFKTLPCTASAAEIFQQKMLEFFLDNIFFFGATIDKHDARLAGLKFNQEKCFLRITHQVHAVFAKLDQEKKWVTPIKSVGYLGQCYKA